MISHMPWYSAVYWSLGLLAIAALVHLIFKRRVIRERIGRRLGRS
jgi:hypothetical protein